MTHGQDENPAATSFALDAPCFGRAKSMNRARVLLSLPEPSLTLQLSKGLLKEA